MKSFLILFISVSLFAFEVPPELKAKYAALYSTPTTQNPDGSTSFGKARHFVRKGIHVLSLEGDSFEMGFQHGRLLKNEIAKGAIPEAADSLKNAIYNSLGNIPIVSDLAVKLAYSEIPDRMWKADFDKTDLYGLSEGSGIPFDQIVYGATGPESLLVLLGIDLQQNWWNLAAPSSASSCTSFVADRSATRDGDVMIGKNTDYALNGYYDRYPLVTYYHPTDGTQKYLSVTSAGLHTAGVVGYNESGIYLDVHTNTSAEVNRDGVPVFFIAQEVLRNAKSFEEAIALFQKAKRPAAAWSYFLVSVHEHKAATIELTAQNIGVRRMTGDTHLQTNHFLVPEMLKSAAHVNLATDEDSIARYQQVEAMLAAKAGKLDEKGAMEILGDKYDPLHHETRGYGNVIAVHTTMTSIVLHPKEHRLLVANGTAPVSQNEYIEFPLEEIRPQTFAADHFETIPNDSFKKHYPKLAKAEQHFIKAKIAYESKLDYRESLYQLEEVLKLDNSAGYRFVYAIVALRTDHTAEAVSSLKMLSDSPDLHYRNLAHYYLGRIAAKNKQKAEAIAAFQFVYSKSEPTREAKLIAATQKAEKAVSESGYLDLTPRDLPLMMQQGDMVKY